MSVPGTYGQSFLRSILTDMLRRNGDQVSALKLQHNKESKGLIVQIRYLKAKFTRESSLRFALVYQKEYLIALLARREKRLDSSQILVHVNLLTCWLVARLL